MTQPPGEGSDFPLGQGTVRAPRRKLLATSPKTPVFLPQSASSPYEPRQPRLESTPTSGLTARENHCSWDITDHQHRDSTATCHDCCCSSPVFLDAHLCTSPTPRTTPDGKPETESQQPSRDMSREIQHAPASLPRTGHRARHGHFQDCLNRNEGTTVPIL